VLGEETVLGGGHDDECHFGGGVAPVLSVLLVLVGSCASHPEADEPPNPVSSHEGAVGGLHGPSRGSTTATNCPLTIPGSVPRRYSWRTSLFGWDSSYGNGRLWVGGLGAHGVIAVDRDSGSVDRHGHVRWKLGWWRDVPGQLVVTGRRVDGAGRLGADAGTVEEYGRRGFVASGVTFSSQGCWQVTGRTDGTSLTFWTRVIIRR
jgi:hypothetical protein